MEDTVRLLPNELLTQLARFYYRLLQQVITSATAAAAAVATEVTASFTIAAAAVAAATVTITAADATSPLWQHYHLLH